MANETTLTIIGNTTGPAELRFTPSGSAVATFTVASTPRAFDRNKNEWVDGETLFMRCSAWREMAENVSETLADKGVRVVVVGRLKQRSFDDKSGEKRTVIELEVDEIGPSLRYANAKVNRTQRGHVDQGKATGAPTTQAWGGHQQAPQDDPWAAPTGSGGVPVGANWGNQPAF